MTADNQWRRVSQSGTAPTIGTKLSERQHRVRTRSIIAKGILPFTIDCPLLSRGKPRPAPRCAIACNESLLVKPERRILLSSGFSGPAMWHADPVVALGRAEQEVPHAQRRPQIAP